MTSFRKANSLFLLEEYDDAIKEYHRAIEQDGAIPLYLSNLALAYEKIGRLGQAWIYYKKALSNGFSCVRAKSFCSLSGPSDDVSINVDMGGRKTNTAYQKRAKDAITRIKRKYFHLGLQKSAVEDFYKAIDSACPAERVIAAFELGLIYLNDATDDTIDEGVRLIERARSEDFGIYADYQYDILNSEALLYRGESEKALAALSETDYPPPERYDVMFARANCHESVDRRIDIVNQVYRDFGFAEISVDSGSVEPYTSLDVLNERDCKIQTGGPLVSIIMPCYNAESTIGVALRSLLKQTWRNIEIIVVDDCSSDGTMAVVKELSEIDHRITLLSTEENSGPYVARNVALEQCRGELVTCNDADDWSHPQKIEAQVYYLANNPHVVAASSRQVRATPDLFFHRRGKAGFFIFDNMSSLMFRKDVVKSELGSWDSVRFGADSEFVKRLQLVFGRKAVASIKTVPLSFQRQADTSLTGNKTFGYHGNFFGARLEYRQSQENYHSQKRSLYYPFPMRYRPFAVPEPMWPRREPGVNGVRHFDVVIASEFRMRGGSVISNIEEIKAHARLGIRTGIVQLARFDQNPNNTILPVVREVLDRGLAELLVYGESISCDLMIVRYPPCMQEQQAFVPNVTAKEIRVIVNQPPMSDYGADGVFRYSIPEVQKNIAASFGRNITWHPIGPLVRDALTRRHKEDLDGINLSPVDWVNIVDIDTRPPSAPERVTGIPRIGRHARDKWIKWPSNREDLLNIYPNDDAYDVRILGGASIPKDMLGSIPSNWTVYEFGKVSPDDYLRELDVFVYYTHPDWVESFGRVVIEAMAAGLPVILDPVYEPLFGDAALYAPPHGVRKLIDRLVSDESFYASRRQASLKSVRARFSYQAHQDRVLTILDKYESNTPLIVPNSLTSIAPAVLRRQLEGYQRQEDGALVKLVDSLIETANEALTRGPFSVTHKTTRPPSEDLHDYWHPAPYWWPNPESPDGLPYIRKDGERVPGTNLYELGSEQFDRSRAQRMFDDTYTLVLAWLFTKRGEYRDKAIANIRVFFIDEETRMNPNLEYAQVRLGHNNNKGFSSGLIEFKDFYFLVDAFRILGQDKAFKRLIGPLRKWLNDYLDWTRTSDQGVKESTAKNNHGTYYDLHVGSIAGYLERDDIVVGIYEASKNRLSHQVADDGSLPEELKRRTTAHYCAYTLQGWLNLYSLFCSLGIKLDYDYKERLKKSVNWYLSYKGRIWPYEQIDEFDDGRMNVIDHLARDLGVISGAIQLENKLIEKPLYCPHDGIKPFWNIG